MKIYRILLIIIGLSIKTVIHSQKISIDIGESTTNKLTKNKSAQLLATFPKNDTLDNSWLVDGYIEIKFNDIPGAFNVGILKEIHKNNLITKEQDVRQFGVTFEKDFSIYKSSTTSDGDVEKTPLSKFIINTTLKHSNDLIKIEKSLIANFGTSFSLERTSKKWRFLQTNTRLINIKEHFFAYIFTIKHNHNLGFSYISGNDSVLLTDASFNINLYPLSRLMNKIEQPDFFQVQYNINARKEVFGETDRDLNTLHTLSAGINYKINDKSSIGISYGFQDGANPYTALDDQNFETISAKLRLVIE